ncbi:hypothetical protein C2857_001528 [Epichloe festucae Fl1]|uniref:Uncharacterized protein n=1 Tax=Epichloe festucae (strain Fl1) TaxID=877507 RepID=A0A7U3SNM2_EPIFF|nr:hypothetical protein C2857_001528 [Epichloe festucae Fl1]
MASPKAKDPLDALQLLVNDVLVQTGKALRASRRDSQGNLPPTYMQAKLPDTINAFHRALGSLERDIINAKSVILRDMNKLKTQNNPAEESQSLPQPQPVEAQSKSPMAIDLDSSPQTISKEEPTDTNKITAIKPAAPFPDMGMGMGMGIPDSAAASITIKEEKPSSHLPSVTEAEGSSKVKTGGKQPTPAAPVPLMDAKLESNSSGLTGGDNVLELTNSDLNFTDMEFTLAPGNDNSTQSGGDGATAANLNGPSFDLGSFGTTNGATATMSLDNHNHNQNNNNKNNNNMPSSTVAQPAASTSGTGPAKTESQPSAEAQKKEERTDAAFADIFAGDGQADGMDFDFSIGDGMGGDTFDDLMNDRDNTFDSMEHGDFDATFFGLDKADEA